MSNHDDNEELHECSWCGAELYDECFRNRRGEGFCSKAHRDASNRALKQLVADEGPRGNPDGETVDPDDYKEVLDMSEAWPETRERHKYNWFLQQAVPLDTLPAPSPEDWELDPDLDEDEIEENVQRYEDIRALLEQGAALWPVVVDEHGFVLDGYHRMAAALSVGLEAVDVLMARRPRENPFLAQPPEASYQGRTMRGVHSHPGFHTSENMDVVMPYAQAKAEPASAMSGDWGSDFPVILGLDMEGLEYFSDYDVDQQFERVRDAFHGELSSFDTFIEASDQIANEDEGAFDDNPIYELKAGVGGGFILFAREAAEQEPARKFASYVLDLDEVDQRVAFRGLRDRELPTEMLAEALEQRRYLDDVDDNRLKVIYFMQPVWEMLYLPYDEGLTQLATSYFIESLTDNGFKVYTTEDAMEGDLNEPDVHLAWGKPSDGLQYHGTSYKNLLAAVPALKGRLRRPPAPFGKHGALEEEARAHVERSLDRPDVGYDNGYVQVEGDEEE